MRTRLFAVVLAATSLFGLQSQAQTTNSGFPKGELSTAKNHTGNIWLSELNVGDSTFDAGIAMATYDPGAKLVGTFIQAVKCYLSQKARASIRRGESQPRSSTRET